MKTIKVLIGKILYRMMRWRMMDKEYRQVKRSGAHPFEDYDQMESLGTSEKPEAM